MHLYMCNWKWRNDVLFERIIEMISSVIQLITCSYWVLALHEPLI